MSCPVSFICISLPAARERRAFMREQFARMAMPATFFDAIAVAPESVDDVPGYALSRRLHRFGYGLTPGEIGCYMSHRGVWRQFLESDGEVCCVPEDDALLLDDFPKAVEDAAAARAHWNVVRLFSLYRRGARPVCVTAGGRGWARARSCATRRIARRTNCAACAATSWPGRAASSDWTGTAVETAERARRTRAGRHGIDTRSRIQEVRRCGR